MSIHGSRTGWIALKRKTRRKKVMKCYEDRRETLSSSGYTNYSEYLKSDDWIVIRASVLACSPQCLLCPSKATQVHHTSYDEATLLGFRKHNLAPICNSCHESIEFVGGIKTDLHRANARLIAGSRKTDQGRKWLETFFRWRRLQDPNDKSKKEAIERKKARIAEDERKKSEHRRLKEIARQPVIPEIKDPLPCELCKKRPRLGRRFCRKCQKKTRYHHPEPIKANPANECSCYRCLEKKSVDVWWVVVCSTCGNKRCPHATDHRLDCGHSNEPGQKGSLYE